MYDIAPCHTSKRTRTFLECNGIPILECSGNSPKVNFIQNVLNIMKKEIGTLQPNVVIKRIDVEASM